MYRSVLAISLCVCGASSALAQQEELQARDVFWSANDLVAVSPNPAAKQKPHKAPTTVPAAHKKTTHETSVDARGASPQTQIEPAKQAQIDPVKVTESGYGAQPHLIKLSQERIGLRYTILQKAADGQYREVLPGTGFHSRDRVKISVMANQPGYLYIVQQGSSGTWSPIFPSSNSARDSNHVEAGRVYPIPSDGAFEFNDQPGIEKVFVVLSREPIQDLDGLIFGLRRPEPSSANAPATEVATNVITDALIQQLASRDLTPVQEQVEDEKSNGDQDGEKAVYVVSSASTNGGDSRVIANLQLEHR